MSTVKGTYSLEENLSPQFIAACAYTSALAAAAGLVFIVIFFTVGGIFGPLNDIAVIIQYILMLPILHYVHQVGSIRAHPQARRIHAIGFTGFAAVIALQSLLVVGILPFTIQIFLVIPAFFVGMAWFVRILDLDQEGIVPPGKPLAVLAGLVVAYPFWAISFARRVRQRTESEGH